MPFVYFLIVLTALYGYGAFFLSRFFPGYITHEAAALVRLVLGITASILFFFLLLCFKLLYPFPVYGFVVVGILALFYIRPSLPKNQLKIHTLPGWAQLILLFIGISLLIYGIIICTPVTSMDALHYHLDIIKRWTAHHGFIYPDVWYAYLPFSVELLYAYGRFFHTDIVSGLFPLLFLLAAVWQSGLIIGLISTNKKNIPEKQILFGGLLVVSVMTCFVTTGHYIETATLFFCLFALYWSLHLIQKPKTQGAGIFAGIGLGLAIGAKTLFLPALPILAGLLYYFNRGQNRQLVFLICTALLVGAPWYIKNIVLTGNPVYPLLSLDYAAAMAGVNNSYGVGRSILDMILLPFNLLFYSSRFDSGYYLNSFLFITPLILITNKKFRENRLFLFISLTVLGLFLVWVFSSQQARFLYLPLMLIGLLLPELVLSLPSALLRNSLLTLAILSMLPSLAANGLYLKLHLPYLLGRETYAQFLYQYVPDYPVTDWVNKHIGKNSLVFFEPRASYYLQGLYEKSLLDKKGCTLETVLADMRYDYYVLNAPLIVLPHDVRLIKDLAYLFPQRKALHLFTPRRCYIYARSR